MRTTYSYFLVLLAGLIGLTQANAQDVPPGFRVVQSAAEGIDPHAVVLLQQLDATYRAMHSFSVEIEEKMGASPSPVASDHCQLAFRRPYKLAVAAQMAGRSQGPDKVITDGKRAFLMLARTPHASTEITPMHDLKSPFEVLGRIQHVRGLDWIERLLTGEGISTNYLGWDLQTLTSKRGKLADGTQVDVLTARWASPRKGSKDWSVDTYAIGLQDHLLHQIKCQTPEWGDLHVNLQYSHPDANLPDSVFELPSDTVGIPLLHVVSSVEDEITFDKGSQDGVALNDILVAYVDRKFQIDHAQLKITDVDKATCKAEILTLHGGGISPGSGAMIIEHKRAPSSLKDSSKTNSWLWPLEKDGATQNALESVDPHALALLKQSEGIYTAMQSFEVGELDKRGRASFSCHGQFAFRRPDHLAFAIGSNDARIAEPKRVLTDGEHAYTLLSRTPSVYFPVPASYRADSPLEKVGRESPGRLYGLLVGKGMKPDYAGLALKSLTSKPEKLTDGTPVEIVEGRWVSTERGSNYWEIDTYTIGQRDHLLCQTSIQTNNSFDSVTRYFHPQTNVMLPDGLFTLPPDAVLLPSAYVTAVETDSVTLDKGSLDGLAISDTLAVLRVSGESKTQVGKIIVATIRAHTCEATILSNSGGLLPGDLCIVDDHRDSFTRAKGKPNNNAWLWTPVRR